MRFKIHKNFKVFLNEKPKNSKLYLNNSNNILNNEYTFHRGLQPVMFDNKIDWDYKHPSSGKTYQLYMHTLGFMRKLVDSFLETTDKIYIREANEIIYSWISSNSDETTINNSAWHEHAVSTRIRNLLYFQVFADEVHKIEDSIFNELFQKHIEYLADKKHYKDNNHGVMMDGALIRAAAFIEDENDKIRYLRIAKNRVEIAIQRDYSSKAIHLENSPDYHIMVTKWFKKIDIMLDELDAPLSSKYKQILIDAESFIGKIINYNNELPIIGDTSHAKVNIRKQHEDLIDTEAGINIFNNRDLKSTMILNCGFKTLTHKHKDDLSIVLSINGEHIIVDSGKYNYAYKDPLRKYIVSPKAHSSILINRGNETYQLKHTNLFKMNNHRITDNYKIASAIHNAYEDIRITRYVIELDSKYFIILDRIKSDRDHVTTYSQNYVFDNTITVSKETGRKFNLLTPKSNNYIIQEHSKIGTSKTFSGSENDAFISKKFGKIIDTTRVEFRKKSKNTYFITSIIPSNSMVDEVSLDKSKLTFKVDKRAFNIDLI